MQMTKMKTANLHQCHQEDGLADAGSQVDSDDLVVGRHVTHNLVRCCAMAVALMRNRRYC